MRNVKWIFFDLGSTLIEENDVYIDRMNRIAKLLNLSYEEVYEHEMKYYLNNKNGDDEIRKEFNLGNPGWAIEKEYPYKDTYLILEELSKKYNLGIIANQLPGLEARLIKYDILKYFKVVAGSQDIGLRKPNLDMFHYAMDKVGAKPEESFMVGDRIDNDVIPAKSLGMGTIWIRQALNKNWNFTSEDEKPDYTIYSLLELLEIFK